MVSEGSATAAAVPLLEDYLTSVARRLHADCGDVAGCAVTLAVDGRPVTIGSSSPVALAVDEKQYEIGTGPCLTALDTGTGLYVPDLARDERWPVYGPAAAELGAACCVSVPVLVEGVALAVVKVYSGLVDGLDERQRELARATSGQLSGGIALAQHLVNQAEELDDRTAAMDSRHTIDLAVGMLMERVGCDADTAFDLLRQQSQHTNVKLRAAAAELVATHDHRAGVPAPFVAAQNRRSPAG
jgi:ANTAR domain-containing protein/GAF domain-containing protein